MITIGSTEVFEKVVQEKVFVLFSADYCPDCQRFKPILERKIEQGHTVAIYYLDTTQLPEVAQQQKVRSIPTLRCYARGEIVDTLNEYTESGLDHFFEKNDN